MELHLRLTHLELDFDEDDFTPEHQQQVVSAVLGHTFHVTVDDPDDRESVAQALAEEVEDRHGWVVFSLDFRTVFF